MLSRLEPQKNPGLLLQAAAQLQQRGVRAQFILAGDGSLAASLRAEARALRLGEPYFRQLEFLTQPQDFYTALDLFVLTSRYEGMPYTLLEAMAQGLPSVATDVVGNREVLTLETGVLVPARATDLAQALSELSQDAAQRARMGAAARRQVQTHFGLERFWEAHRQAYFEPLPQESPQ
jgi:glycosyltransferase involved in cell wall biosynthesis